MRPVTSTVTCLYRGRWIQLWHGSVAWELDIGRLVIQVPYRTSRHLACFAGRRIHVWTAW